MITNNAEEKPKQNPAASWVFMVTGYNHKSCSTITPFASVPTRQVEQEDHDRKQMIES